MENLLIINNEKLYTYIDDFIGRDANYSTLILMENENKSPLDSRSDRYEIKKFKAILDSLKYDITRFKNEKDYKEINENDLLELNNIVFVLNAQLDMYKKITKILTNNIYEYNLEEIKMNLKNINKDLKYKITMAQVLMNLQPSFPSYLANLSNILNENGEINVSEYIKLNDIKEILNEQSNKNPYRR